MRCGTGREEDCVRMIILRATDVILLLVTSTTADSRNAEAGSLFAEHEDVLAQRSVVICNRLGRELAVEQKSIAERLI